MKALTAECRREKLRPSEGAGHGLLVELKSAGDELVPFCGVFLVRKGINLLPEFAEGFGLDATKVIPGLEPEAYQFRVEMLLRMNDTLMYGDGKSEGHFTPGGRGAQFLIPVPFKMVHVFAGAPPEDVYVAVASLSGGDFVVTLPGLHAEIVRILSLPPSAVTQFPVRMGIRVPQSVPVGEADMRAAGTYNIKPIRPMPNT